ncbi:uncharacterized protein DNG_02312 [Cephalotrichum gorgonifer]|uniref:Uncharacterized protein n=1 Tax=Cephalotrichum gorgonifer TaxID=2041049 RepID=A0AAE8MU95_9PEZI|nr:uncharacterized protein DNG_02312 [Cephalotrichum gorgonifer]
MPPHSDPGSQGSASDPFIVSTTPGKPDPATRKFIRSHVMRGKNLGKLRPRKGHGKQRRNEKSVPARAEEAAGAAPDHGAAVFVPAAPRRIASELSAYRYVVDIKPYMFNLIYRALTLIKPSTFTLEKITDGDLIRSSGFCFQDLPDDAALIHSVVFAAQSFYDMAAGTSRSDIAGFHFGRTVHYLQRNLNSSSEVTKDYTLSVVILLATAACLDGDFETATKHRDGLYKVIDLRGGLDTIAPGGLLEQKIQTLDLGLAIGIGSEPRFIRDGGDISWSPHIARGRSARKFPEFNFNELHDRPDPMLLGVWADLRELSAAANRATYTDVKIPVQYFSDLSTSVPYRLIRLDGYEPTSLNEMLRLAMTAYMKYLVVKTPLFGGDKRTYLASRLKTALIAQAGYVEHSRTLLWALFIAKASMFPGFLDEWLKDLLVKTVSSLGLGSWTDVRLILKEFLWVDVLMDEDGADWFRMWCAPGQDEDIDNICVI